jgi:hypothetical protein
VAAVRDPASRPVDPHDDHHGPSVAEVTTDRLGVVRSRSAGGPTYVQARGHVGTSGRLPNVIELRGDAVA